MATLRNTTIGILRTASQDTRPFGTLFCGGNEQHS